MGVDAEILIKITKPESWLTEEQIRRASSRLTSVLGATKFFLRPEEDRHALYLYEKRYRDDSIVMQPNEQFIGVNLWSRYYGEGYARGDWKTLCFAMLWMISNLKDSEVWYGGDSSGICAERMTPSRLMEITEFYLTSGNSTYWMNSSTEMLCEFCQCGVVNSGDWQGHHFFHCDGCDSKWLVKDGTLITKHTNEDDGPMDSFKVSNEVGNGSRKMFPFDGTFRQIYPHVKKLHGGNLIE